MRTTSRLVVSVFLLVASASCLHASTAAFCGKIVAVDACPPNHKECLAKFTVEIDYFDYISWGKFNKDSKAGETITRQVRTRGTVCILNGELTNASTLAAAMAAGQRGYFYEDTWHDLYTTGDFEWGEVVAHDPKKREVTLRVHATHKQFHLAANPPREVTISYDDETTFQIEAGKSNAEGALKPGNWIQVHPPREQIVQVRSEKAGFKPDELLPQAEGKRGYANDLSAPAILSGFETKPSDEVIDISGTLTATRTLRGKTDDVSINCRSVTFILDGKLAPPAIAVKQGRRSVLGYYRNQQSPHKVFVQSHDIAVRGKISVVGDGKVTIDVSGNKPAKHQIAIDTKAVIQLDGRPTSASDALAKGRTITVHPKRGTTIVAFEPQTP